MVRGHALSGRGRAVIIIQWFGVCVSLCVVSFGLGVFSRELIEWNERQEAKGRLTFTPSDSWEFGARQAAALNEAREQPMPENVREIR